MQTRSPLQLMMDQILAILDTTATPDQLVALETLLTPHPDGYLYRLATMDNHMAEPPIVAKNVRGIYKTITSARCARPHAREPLKIQRARVEWEDVE